LNLLSPGDVTYDLKTRTSSLGNPPDVLEREFDALTLPAGAGPLFLGGDQLDTLKGSAILEKFKAVAGENILIVATGYPSSRSAETAIKKYTEGLGVQVQSLVVGDEPIVIPDDVTAVLVVGKDTSKVKVEALAPLKNFWLAGKPVMADNAVTPVFGAFYSNHEPTPDDSELQELATQKSFWQGRTKMAPGLGFLNITIEPQLLADLRFGRLFSLAYNHPEFIAIGVNKDTAIMLDENGATALGLNGIFILDLRKAKLQLGTNDGFVINNGMLDIFAPGESIQAEIADVNARFDPAPTPVLPTQEPTATATVAATPTQLAIATPSIVPTSPTAMEYATTPKPAAFPLWTIAVVVAIAVALLYFWKRK
jgi:hypothetical protein